MALVTRSADASADTRSLMKASQIAGDLFAGEDLDPVAPCYIKQADGLVYMSAGAAANEAAGIDGVTPKSYKAGQPVTLYGAGSRFRYSSGMTPGVRLFIGATKGRLDTAATTGDAVGVAKAINATDIRIIRDA